MIKIAALVVVFIILASVFVFAACKAKTPRSITDKFENLAEDGSFNNESGGKGDSVVFDFGKKSLSMLSSLRKKTAISLLSEFMQTMKASRSTETIL